MTRKPRPKAKAAGSQASASDKTEAKHSGLIPFVKGQSGNPAGRPKGARSKLGEAFLEALHDDFGSHGADVIARVRENDPAAYMRVVASILPKEVKIETTSDLTDEQLDARIRQLAAFIEIGVAGSTGGAPEAVQPQPPEPVRSVH